MDTLAQIQVPCEKIKVIMLSHPRYKRYCEWLHVITLHAYWAWPGPRIYAMF